MNNTLYVNTFFALNILSLIVFFALFAMTHPVVHILADEIIPVR